MIGKHLHLVLAGVLGMLSPCLAADNGPAHFNPNALLAENGGGSSLPISTGPNAGAPPPDSGGGATLPISTPAGGNGGASAAATNGALVSEGSGGTLPI